MSGQLIEYYLEVYEDSFINDPVWSVQSPTPFPALHIGERFNSRGLGELAWNMAPIGGDEFRIKDIDHIFWDVGGVIGHKLMVKLKLTRPVHDDE